MFNTILIAIDLEALNNAERAVEAARSVASDGAALHVVNVVPEVGRSMVGASLGPNYSKQMLEENRKTLKDWAAKALPEASELHVVQGTIYDQIIRMAKKIDADVIIVGAHRPELRDYLVGPNAARVVRHAKQSVIVIR